jgi:hypothetical protein
MQSGARYQNRAAAWLAVQMLAENDLPWDLPASTTAESINCETTNSADDIFATTSSGGRIYVQAKARLLWNADFVSALTQCVRQYRDLCGAGGKSAPLDPKIDRLLVIGGQNSSEPIRVHLLNVLARLRAPDTVVRRVRDAARNKAETDTLTKFQQAMMAIWRTMNHSRLTESELRNMCAALYIAILDVDGDGEQARGARADLQRDVVVQRQEAARAWTEIVAVCTDLAVLRNGTDRELLRSKLQAKGFSLQGRPSYRSDIRKLEDLAVRTKEHLERHSEIVCAGHRLHIERTCSLTLESHIEDGHIVVVGDPGAGKSGALYAFATRMRDRGKDVLLMSADDIAAGSLGELRQELGLEHEIRDVLKAWSGVDPAYLILDALDSAQTASARHLLQRLIDLAIALKSRWRVVLTIRKWDLRHNSTVQALFRGQPVDAAYSDAEFSQLRHLNVPVFDDEELKQVRATSTLLALVIDQSPVQLGKLLRLPFNLRLLASLIDSGLTIEELTPIRTQIELLERYWSVRVLGPDHGSGAAEILLRPIVREKVQARSREYSKNRLTDIAMGPIMTELLRESVLVEFVTSASGKVNSSVIAFSHHLIQDYAVARLVLRGKPADLCRELESDPDIVIWIWVSLEMHFHYLWWYDRDSFWETVFVLEASARAPMLAKLVGPAAAADLIEREADFDPLVKRMGHGNAQSAATAFSHLVGRLSAKNVDSLRPLVGENAPPWARLLAEVSKS